MLVNGARDQFLARAGFAADENVHWFGGDAPDFLVDGLHGLAMPHQRVARRALLPFPQRHRLAHEAIAPGRLLNQLQQLRHVERLEQILERPQFGGFNGGVGRPKSGGENNRQARLGGVQLADQLQTAQTGQSQVGDDHVERIGRGAGQAVVPPFLHRYVVAFAGQHAPQSVADAGIVFYQ